MAYVVVEWWIYLKGYRKFSSLFPFLKKIARYNRFIWLESQSIKQPFQILEIERI